MRKFQANHAFTLIEMLVSIAIGLIVLVLAQGAVKSALSRTHDVECLLNLRQVGVMLHQFTAENAGYFPCSYRNSTKKYWFQQLADAASADSGSSQNPETPKNVFMCPVSTLSWKVEGGKFHGNYGWNISYGNQWDEGNPNLYLQRESRNNVKAQEAAVVADVNSGAYAPPYAIHWFSLPLADGSSNLDFRHSGDTRAHVLFADGSARAIEKSEATADFFNPAKHRQP